MKLNPKLFNLIENRIEDSNENPYILFEESDIKNFKNLIEECCSDKKQVQELTERVNIYDGKLVRVKPYRVLKEIIEALQYRKRASGYEKIMNARSKYFPNWNKIEIAENTSKAISNFRSLQNSIDLYQDELFDEAILEEN